VALGLREKAAATNDLFDRLAADARLGLSRTQIEALVADRSSFIGTASAQVSAVVDRIAAIVALHPDAGQYAPAPIL
jgi:adenylosuccinate lyase